MFPKATLSFLRCKLVMSSPIGILWTFLSVMVAGTCCFSFLQPFWFFHPDYVHSFGMYNYCVREPNFHRQTCEIYGGYFNFSNMPSGAWQAACVLFGGGCAFLCLSACLALLSLFVSTIGEQKPAIVGGYFQTVAVLMLIAGLVIYPLGLGSPFMRYYCGKSAMFDAGHCSIGWSYMLAIMGTSLTVFCPILSQFTDAKVDVKRPDTFV